ncbi:MAG: hypothetical protein OXC69_01230, partial [Candidatus Tectomicrobia bacterium]|nr:hypothetical protein [Candidatus Tectomicrobia bacterium]
MPEDSVQRDILAEDKLPPELTYWRRVFLWFARILMVAAICWLIYICFQMFLNPAAVPKCFCWSYLALAGFLSGLVTEFFIRHRARVHESRKEDRSEIEALIQEAKSVQPRLTEPEDRPARFEERREQIDREVQRLTRDVGPEGWTEFQVLTLDRMLIDFLPLEDLKARARSSLDELKQYAYGEAFSYDDIFYRDWEQKINSNIKSLEELDNDEEDGIEIKRDNKAEALRANLRAVREHAAEYQARWAEGKTIVSGIRICGATSVIVFTLMGILPLLHPVQNCPLLCAFHLSILNWGLLGIAGAIAMALLELWNAKEVEVADTAGKQVLSRVLLSAPLGLLAGVLVFSALAGGVIESGSAVPNLLEPGLSDAYLSILW